MNTQQNPPTTASQLPDQELAAMILAYLSDRPRATDTTEGIARWWILRQQIQMAVAQVERVLADLTEKGVLEAVGTGPTRRFRLGSSADSPTACD